jgi:hypothetical protein
MGFRRVLIVSTLAFVVATIFLWLLYTQWGGKYYLSARRLIKNSPPELKQKSEQIFNSESRYYYSGILMAVNKRFYPGVWVWGDKGPRYFGSDQYSVFIHSSMCSDEALGGIKAGEIINPERTVFSDISEWYAKVEVGDFIVVQTAGPSNGGNIGRLREAIDYDWWVFDSVTQLEKQCER